MNEQSNFNNQFNNQPLNNEVLPKPHVKKKFFTNTFVSNNANQNIGSDNSSNTNSILAWGLENNQSMQQPMTQQNFVNANNNINSNVAPNVSPSAMEMLQNVNGTIAIEEPEVLDGFDMELPLEKGNVEELDFPEETKTKIEVPKIDQGIPSVQGNGISVNTTQIASVFKPSTNQISNDFNLGYNAQVINQNDFQQIQSVQPIQTIEQAQSTQPMTFNQNVDNGMVPIFDQQVNAQSTNYTNQVIEQNPVNNGVYADWMTNQPLSISNVENSSAVASNVIPANQREEEYKRQLEVQNNPPTPVLEEKNDNQESINIRPELLTKEYIGEDYTKFMMSPFNFGGFLFGAAYFAYRKLYFTGIINLLVAFALFFLVPFKYNFLAILGFHILMGLAVNRIFVFKAKMIGKSAKKNNEKKGNPKTQEELETIMRLRGNSSIINALLIICAFVAGIFFLSRSIFKDYEVSKFVNKSIGFIKVNKETKEEFDGTLNFDSNEDVNDYISITIPDVFIGTNDNVIDYGFTTMSTEKNNQCNLRIGILKDFNNGDSFLVKLAAYNTEEEKIKRAETKGIEWTNYYTEDKGNIIYYKATTIDDRALVFEYKIGKDSTENICDAFYVSIMESIELRED